MKKALSLFLAFAAAMSTGVVAFAEGTMDQDTPANKNMVLQYDVMEEQYVITFPVTVDFVESDEEGIALEATGTVTAEGVIHKLEVEMKAFTSNWDADKQMYKLTQTVDDTISSIDFSITGTDSEENVIDYNGNYKNIVLVVDSDTSSDSIELDFKVTDEALSQVTLPGSHTAHFTFSAGIVAE